MISKKMCVFRPVKQRPSELVINSRSKQKKSNLKMLLIIIFKKFLKAFILDLTTRL